MSFRKKRIWAAIWVILFLTAGLWVHSAPTVRIKDVAGLEGVRENQLLGIGLVTGLSGKGDSSGSVLLRKTISNLMAGFGLEIDPKDVKSRNCAMVMVSADVPSFVRPGERIDLSVSSIGDARSLTGGILLQTNLNAANGEVYAVAQGTVMVGRTGFETVGTVNGGGIVEKEILSRFVTEGKISILLRNPDFVTAGAVADSVREAFDGIAVDTRDASLIDITVPSDRVDDIVGFIGEIESLTITPDVSGKVVIDSQSGIIIIGENVGIGRVAVAYEDVRIQVGASVWGKEEKPQVFVMDETTDVEDLVEILQAVGLETEVIIGIMKAIDAAGALYGRLIVL